MTTELSRLLNASFGRHTRSSKPRVKEWRVRFSCKATGRTFCEGVYPTKREALEDIAATDATTECSEPRPVYAQTLRLA